MQISYSSVEKYNTCPYLYKLHYIERIRSSSISSALFYGGYIGEVFQAKLMNKIINATPEEKELAKLGIYDYFDELMKSTNINGKTVELYDPRVIYYKGDYDESLLTPEDFKIIEGVADKLGMFVDDSRLKFEDFIEQYYMTTDNEIKTYMNWHFYLSLRRKGFMMIDSFMDEIYPNISKVYAIEKPIKIDLSLEGDPEMTDYLIGYIDIICDFKIMDPKLAAKLEVEIGTVKKVLFDFKTSSARYGQKKLIESVQLNLYDYVEGNIDIGYIVAVKKIKKPKIGPRKGTTFCDIQVMIGTRDEVLQEEILDNCEEVLEKIEAEEFPKNLASCKFQFGRPCVYNGYCHNNGDMTGLVKKEK